MEEITQQKTTFAACKMELEQKVNQLQSEITLQKTQLHELGKLLTCQLHLSDSECMFGLLLSVTELFNTQVQRRACMHTRPHLRVRLIQFSFAGLAGKFFSLLASSSHKIWLTLCKVISMSVNGVCCTICSFLEVL